MMAKVNSKRIRSKVSEFFTGAEGSFFWLVGQIFIFLKEVIEAINESLEIRRESKKRLNDDR
jgi:hypothetical protein